MVNSFQWISSLTEIQRDFSLAQNNKRVALFPKQTSRSYETELTALKEDKNELSTTLNTYQLEKERSIKSWQATTAKKSELQLLALPIFREILQTEVQS